MRMIVASTERMDRARPLSENDEVRGCEQAVIATRFPKMLRLAEAPDSHKPARDKQID